MGNSPSGASQGQNQKKILKQKLVKGHYEKLEIKTSLSAPDVNAKSLLVKHVEKEQVGSMAEDIIDEGIRHIPLEEDSFESVDSKSPPKTCLDTDSNINCQFVTEITLKKKQEDNCFTGSEIPPTEMMEKKEDNIEGKKKGAGNQIFKDTVDKMPQASSLPPIMLSHNSQLCRTSHKAEAAAPDDSLTASKKDKAQTYVANPSPALQVGFTKAQTTTIPSMDILDTETENITKTAETSDLMKTSPREEQPFTMYVPKTKLTVATQLAPAAGFSYADILKHNLLVTPPRKLSDARPEDTQQNNSSVVATISLGKGEKRLAMQQTCNRDWKAQYSNKVGEIYHRKSENLQEKMPTTNPKTEDTKQAVASNTSVSPLYFMYTGEKPRYEWISPPKMPQECFTFSESWNSEEKTEAFVPEHLDMSLSKDQEKAHDIITSCPRSFIPENFPDPSIRNPPEQRPAPLAGTDMQGVLSKTCPVPTPCKSMQESTDYANKFRKLGAIPKKNIETLLPQAKDLSALKSASSKGQSSKQSHSQRKSPRKQPKVKVAHRKPIFPSQTTRKDQTLVKQQISVSEWNSKHSAQSLPVVEKASSDELTTSTQTHNDNIIQDEKTLDPAPADLPPKIWKDFYVDTTCTKKCRCKHRPGKLPPNITKWMSVSENRLAEPPGVITLKLASSLVAGTKLLLDHTASIVSLDSIKQKEQPK